MAGLVICRVGVFAAGSSASNSTRDNSQIIFHQGYLRGVS